MENAGFITGSHAYGNPNRDSDLDLVVIVDEGAFVTRDCAVKLFKQLMGEGYPIEDECPSNFPDPK